MEVSYIGAPVEAYTKTAVVQSAVGQSRNNSS